MSKHHPPGKRPYGSVKAIVGEHTHLTAREIINRFGVSRFSVYYAARRMGVKLPPHQPSKRFNYASI